MTVSPGFQLAQVNIAKMRAPLDSPVMRDFTARIQEINALADRSPGFVWRTGLSDGASYLRPFDDDSLLFNLSVWESIEHLRDYVYQGTHRELFQDRQRWFEPMAQPHLALWRVPRGHQPSVAETKERLEHLRKHGETPVAFSFRKAFPPPRG